MNATQVRRWIAGFEAIAEVDRQALRKRGADPALAISLALSMIEAAGEAGRGRAAIDPFRAAEDEAVRATWRRLRERSGR